MPQRGVESKSELLAETEKSWDELNTTLDRLTDAQKTSVTDSHGWTVKDHVVHLAAWERSVIFFLQGKSPHGGLGVDESLYLGGDEDAINAVIFQKQRNLPLADAMEELRDTHRQLLKLVQKLDDADLQRPYRYFVPEDPREGDGPPAMKLLYANMGPHFSEHREWIRALVGDTD